MYPPRKFHSIIRTQKPDLALQNGDTQPPQVIFWGYVYVGFVHYTLW